MKSLAMLKNNYPAFTLVEILLGLALLGSTLVILVVSIRNLNITLLKNEIDTFITFLELKRLESRTTTVRLSCQNGDVFSESKIIFKFSHHTCSGSTDFSKTASSTFTLTGQSVWVVVINPHGVLSIE